jgi:hypothetical protein
MLVDGGLRINIEGRAVLAGQGFQGNPLAVKTVKDVGKMMHGCGVLASRKTRQALKPGGSRVKSVLF